MLVNRQIHVTIFWSTDANLRHNKTDTYINNPSVKHQSVVESPSDGVLRRINVCVSDRAPCDKKKIKRQIPTCRAGVIWIKLTSRATFPVPAGITETLSLWERGSFDVDAQTTVVAVGVRNAFICGQDMQQHQINRTSEAIKVLTTHTHARLPLFWQNSPE